MNRNVGFSRVSVVVSGLVVFALAWPVSAADPVESKPIPAADADTDDDAFRELSIYIPYEKLREVFEKKGRGVFLPYEEFEKLWRAARDKKGPTVDDGPPIDALIDEV